jgi:4-diphosphocytidyl-2-C-methyl-D-erythritol kinase
VPEATELRQDAPAKINPYLRVRGRRPDGFHEIETVIQPITLLDTVAARAHPELSLQVIGERAGAVPRGDENSVIQAVEVLRTASATEDGAQIILEKQIPVSAGLGGGSSDAAAVLRVLNHLWTCGFAVQRLAALGAEVGSDVPALVLGGPVLARGRGEAVVLVGAAPTWWVLLVPEFGIRAAEAYGWWDEDPPEEGPHFEPLLRALAGGDVLTLAGLLWNGLEGPVVRRRPEMGEAKATLLRAGALAAVMCGSGPAVAGLCRDEGHAGEVAEGVGGLAVSAITSHQGPAG